MGSLKSGSALTAKTVRDAFLSVLKTKAVEFALAKLAKGVMRGAFGNWLIAFATKYLMEEFVIPLMKIAFNYMGYRFMKVEGNYLIKKLENSENENDQNRYDDIIDDIWNS